MTTSPPGGTTMPSSDATSVSHDVPNTGGLGSVAAPTATSLAGRFPNGINWTNAIWLAAMHAGAIAAFWFISWQAVVMFVVFYYATGCFGVTLGYHRQMTHGSYQTIAPVRAFLTLCAMLSGQGSPLFWIATHRKHHAHSDGAEDPHTPNHGFLWSHVLWLQPRDTAEGLKAHFERWAPDFYRSRLQRFLHATYGPFLFLSGAAFFAIGEIAWGLGLSVFLWAMCLRIVVVYHVTWFVNSATHVWGYRNYHTTDRSRNLWWVGLLAFGEGWHNNHHAHQRMARHGHKPWEFDLTYNIIRVMKLFGLATEVVDALPNTDDAQLQGKDSGSNVPRAA
ncbi:MAG TPA: delta-9 desaturase [Planctomycetaceae bacterium]|nr:delta-9 desaturase [Planctomycetaceae bacterium]